MNTEKQTYKKGFIFSIKTEKKLLLKYILIKLLECFLYEIRMSYQFKSFQTFFKTENALIYTFVKICLICFVKVFLVLT